MATRIRTFPAAHVELRIHASDEMIKDFKECRRVAEESNNTIFKECENCSWNEIKMEGLSVCTFEGIEEKILGLEDNKN